MTLFQLVLQFAPWNGTRFNDLVILEERLVAAIGSRATVDGHDAGAGEANIFLLTEHPNELLTDCIAVVQQSALPLAAAGYRDLEGEDYQRVWPPGDHSPFRVK